MWICNNCGEEISKDKYKVCWNCGKPKQEAETAAPAPAKIEPSFKIEAPVEIKPLAQINLPQKVEPPRAESVPIAEEPDNPSASEDISSVEQATFKDEPPRQTAYEENFLSQYESAPRERSSSVVGKIIPVLLWLAAFSAVGYFTYSSYQKTQEFEKQIAANLQNFSSQKFVFPQIPQLRRGDVLDGNVRAKVLPVRVETGEVDPLYSYLPDDLRPVNADEVKTMMWLGCENNPVEKYPDGTTGYREKCTVYLVEKETAKFIAIQEFLGVMPALAKQKTGEDAVGRVYPEKYVAYLREKQPDAERGLIQSSSESPDHHFYNKSEFIYALFTLGLLAAIGLGWLAFNLRFKRNLE